ncbi:hypothetical protein [Kalamiella sp. sgz302252]|uniref:DUF7661 family protein n=1 Tax=Pantoea sp. sgz302252 TaxID=3341827 RepID=UPI0036D37BF7
MLIYQVFNRYIGVKREQTRWLAYRIDLSERKSSPLRDVIIPDELTEAELPGWLGDLFHESASEKYPDVRRIE